MTDASEAVSRADKLLMTLGDLPAMEALQVLNRATAEILRNVESTDTEVLKTPVIEVPAHLLERRPGRPPMIESDPELRDFIHGLERGLSIMEIKKRCLEEFGEDRAPGKNAIWRYIQRMRKLSRRRTEARDE